MSLLAAAPVMAQSGINVYVPNSASQTVSVIDAGSNTVTATVNNGAATGPQQVAVRGDQAFAYVANGVANTVSVINTATNTVVATIGVGTQPAGIVISPDGRSVYVANSGSNNVSVISTASNTVTATINVGSGPTGIAITPNGQTVYTTNQGSSDVSAISTATNTVVSTINVGPTPFGLAVTPDGTTVYVALSGSSSVRLIATATNTAGATIAGFNTPIGVAVSPDGSTVYVTDGGGTTVTPIPTATNVPGATIAVGNSPFGVVFTPNGQTAYVANNLDNTVTPITVGTSTPGAAIAVGGIPTLPGVCSNGNALLQAGNTFMARSAGALGCTGTAGPTFTGGTLQLLTGLATSQAMTLGGAGGTVDSNGFDATLSGTISGAGGLTKAGTGTLILTGNNSYGGGTSIAGGTLQIGNGGTTGAIAGNVLVAGGAALAFSRSDAVTFGGAISGGGSLVKLGSNTLTLTGNNSYTGGTTVSGGILLGSTDAIQGNILNNALVIFANSTTGTYAGSMSGTGGVVVSGTAGATFSGNNSYSGGTAIFSTLQVSQDRNLGAPTGKVELVGGTLRLGGSFTTARNFQLGGFVTGGTFDTNGFNLTVGGNVTGGTGNVLTKTGAGVLALNGTANSVPTTSVTGGTLVVGDSNNPGAKLTSAVTVNSGGAFGGSGTLVGNLAFGNGGALTPGNSIGTIGVTGNVSFAAQSVYVVEINPQGQADRIVATGTATIQGGTVQVQAETGFYRKDTRYTILTAAGGVIGTFTTLTTNLAFLDLSLVYDANNVYLNVDRNSVQFAQLAHTENQLAVGKALDVFALNPPGADATMVSNALFNLSEPQARAAYDQISGAAHGNLVMSSLTIRRMFGRALDDRLMQEQGGAAARASAAQPGNAQFALAGTAGQDFAPLLAAASATNGESRDTSSGWHTWVKGLGQFNSTSGNSNAQGYDLTIGGALLGADIMPLKGLRVGAAIGYAHGDFDGDSNSGSGGIDSYQGLIYGRYDHGKFFFADAQAGYAFNQYDLDRGISFSTISRTASSDADGHDVSAQLRIGAKLDSRGFNIVPSASLRYDRLWREDFIETGADSLNLSVESKSFTALRSSIGARTSYPLKLDESGIEIEPYAGAYWQHDFRNGAAPVEARFSGIGIDVQGTEVGRDAAVLQIGAAAVLDDRFTLFAGYDTELRARQTDHAISAGMRYRW